MFDYKEFKKEMSKRGHEVHKNGKYLTIIPNNNYEGYSKGFLLATDIIKGFEDMLNLGCTGVKIMDLSIGQMARINHISIQTLRLYDKIKITVIGT